MKIFAISIIKNEADIIRYNLNQASFWADKIFVLDNGSTDGSWEIVQSMANGKIIPWKQYWGPFNDSLRSEIFNEFRYESNPGDWWCRKLDADEIYLDNPRIFLQTVPKAFQVVYSESIEFYLTVEDIEQYVFGELFEENITKIKYYRPTSWSELVFFKYRKRLQWPSDYNAPKRTGVVFQDKIRLKHYKYRSPNQIINRQATRKGALTPAPEWKIGTQHWKQLLKQRSELFEDLNGQFPLIGCRNNHYFQPLWKHWIKRIMHHSGLWP